MIILTGVIASGFRAATPSLISARYWRVRGLSSNNTTYLGFADVEMRLTAGGADQTTEAQTIYGDQNGTKYASNAFDANETTTFWNTRKSVSVPTLSWIGQDFGSDVTITEMRFGARVDANNYDQTPDEIEVEYSYDNITWVSILSINRGPNSWTSGLQVVYTIQ